MESWGSLGQLWGDPWGYEGRFRDPWELLGACWGSLGHPWGYPGDLLEALGVLLGVTWISLGGLGEAFWAVFGATIGIRWAGAGNCALNENIDKTCVFSLFLRF